MKLSDLGEFGFIARIAEGCRSGDPTHVFQGIGDDAAATRISGDAPRSSAARSTPGRQVEVSTVGRAKTASNANAGWIDTNKAIVTPSRKIQPPVLNSDMYMWSSTNTWSRNTASRSRYSGRS